MWVYKNYEPNYSDPGSSDICDKTLYLFAFWVTTSNYIIMGAVYIISCLGGGAFSWGYGLNEQTCVGTKDERTDGGPTDKKKERCLKK